MSSQIPTSKRHKRVRSADLMELDELDKSFLPRMHDDLQNMKSKLEQEHMLVKALDPALENINSVLESLKNIQEYKQRPENQGITISVRFSCSMYFNELIKLLTLYTGTILFKYRTEAFGKPRCS